ncbi:YqeB family protein [Streptomyces avermitilis]|uniref:YqeB family protein n=1 Tax=Streptomyces avermitilis TaxID=33903 RepID=UPI0033BBCB9C
MRKKPDPRAQKATVLAESAWVITLFCVGCGAGIGWLVTLLADWLVTLPWAPLEGPAKLLTSIPEPGLTIGAVAVGALLGLLVGFIAVHESLSAGISDSRVVLTIRDASQEFTYDEIALVFRDGKQLVLLGPNGLEIAREDCGLPWRRLADAFAEHGYRWADEDPYRHEFRRWVPGTPGLPEGADALLRARAEARNKEDDAEDARELRAELTRLGVVVRDESKRQYWRMPQQPGATH